MISEVSAMALAPWHFAPGLVSPRDVKQAETVGKSHQKQEKEKCIAVRFLPHKEAGHWGVAWVGLQGTAFW